MTEAELRIERQKLVGRQYAIANEINSFYPRSVGAPTSERERALCREAEGNAAAIRAIDRELDDKKD